MHIEEIIAQEIALVSKITGVEPRRIELNQGGLQCRVYIINDGQIVFKFPRKNSKGQHSVRFDVEKKVVGIVNQLPQTVSLPKVLYESNNDSYLGFTGVKGENLKYGKLSKIQAVSVGKQVANFIKQLHIYSSQNRNLTVPIYGLESQIEIWLGWYNKEIFKSLGFTLVEVERIDILLKHLIEKLRELKEQRVLSHGDLSQSNILFDYNNNKVGVIDFNLSGYYDIAADFSVLHNPIVCNQMLNQYGADDVLREKVKLRRAIRAITVIGISAMYDKKEKVKEFVLRIRESLKEYEQLF